MLSLRSIPARLPVVVLPPPPPSPSPVRFFHHFPRRRPSTFQYARPPRIDSTASPLRRAFSRTSWPAEAYRNEPRRYVARPVNNFAPPPPPPSQRPFVFRPSTQFVVVAAIAAAVAFYFANIEVVPVSGRRRFNCFSASSLRRVADMQYEYTIEEVEAQGGRFLPDWDDRTRLVKKVMARLIPVSGLEGQEWEVRVIDDPHTANAFVLPGGKVFVFSGIFPIVQGEAGLAAVLGHEIAHNVAEHFSERLSQAVGVNILLGSALMLSAAILPAILTLQFTRGLLDILFGMPMDRIQESEADYIGLMMMAEACYDPRAAVGFWKRMNEAQHFQVPEWLSTHPSNQNRIEKIQEAMPTALEKMAASDCRGTQSFADLFRRAMREGIVMI